LEYIIKIFIEKASLSVGHKFISAMEIRG